MLVPIELLVKGAVHLSPTLEPYTGLGPALVVPVGAGHASPHYGVAWVGGTNLWATHHVGGFCEANVTELWGGESPETEVGGVAGLIVGW